MSDRRFFALAWSALVAVVALAIVANFIDSVGILFNVLLSAIGVYCGYLFTVRTSDQERIASLGRYAVAGHQLSLDVHDSLQEVVDLLSSAESDVGSLTRRRFEIAREKLTTTQRFALSANRQWEEVLPPERRQQTQLRYERIMLKSGGSFVIREEDGDL